MSEPNYEYEVKPIRGGAQQCRLKMTTADTKIEITVRAKTREEATSLLRTRLKELVEVV